MPFGLTEKTVLLIIKETKKHPDITEVIIYGSRAIGNYKEGSDIDLALKGDVSLKSLSSLKYNLEEVLLLPYFFDVLIYENISNLNLKKHIDEFGKRL